MSFYSFSKKVKRNCDITSDSLIKDNIGDFQFISGNKEQKADKVIYSNGKVLFTKKEKDIEICSDSIEHIPSKKSLYIANGWINIKGRGYTESFCFNQLYANLRDDEVELTLVIKEINNANIK